MTRTILCEDSATYQHLHLAIMLCITGSSM